MLDYFHLSSTGEDTISAMSPSSESFVFMIGKTYDSYLNSHQPFGMLLGEKPTEPVALDLSNKSLSTSSPFEFRIRTDFWSVQNREFEFEDMSEEQNFGWLNIDIESDGTLNFSGIAPVFEGTVPIQFAINENISGESLVIQFTIEISSHSKSNANLYCR